MLRLDHLNAYIEKAERAFFRRCGVCRTRRFFSLWHEVYALGDSCEGQCKGTCTTGWTYACSECTLKVATGCLDRSHFARYQVQLDTLHEVMDFFDCEESDSAAHFYDKIESLHNSISADLQHDGC